MILLAVQSANGATQTIAAQGPFTSGPGGATLKGRTVQVRITGTVTGGVGMTVSCDGTNFGAPVLKGNATWTSPTAAGTYFFALAGDFTHIKWDSTATTAQVFLSIMEVFS